MPPKNSKSNEADKSLVRLQKFLSNASVTSRRKAEELIVEGSVRVNGKIVNELGTRINPERDIVTIDGERVRQKELKYVILHKPAGVVSSRTDPKHRTTVLDFLPDMGVNLYPVGRLDYDATGLVLLTNDGDAAMALTHPSFKTARIYMVKVKGEPADKHIERLRKGVYLDDGKKTLPAKVERVEVRQKGKAVSANSYLKFILHEGRNRQIRRMCIAVRHPAIKIHRVIMGPLKLGKLPLGTWRYATKAEVGELQRLARKVARQSKPSRK